MLSVATFYFVECAAIFPLTVFSMKSEMLSQPSPLEMELNGEELVARTFLKTEDVFFDIGANYGDYTKIALVLNIPLTIYAFEPVHSAFSLLVYNLEHNTNFRLPQDRHKIAKILSALKNENSSVIVRGSTINLFELALGNREGAVDFYMFPEGPGLSGCYFREILKNEYKIEKTSVKCTTLDTFCDSHGIKHINFIKIDTEGAEVPILYGANNMLKNHAIDFIQFEYGGCYIDAKTTLKQAYDYLTERGYALFKICPKGLIHITKWDDKLEDYVYSNYFACRSELFSFQK